MCVCVWLRVGGGQKAQDGGNRCVLYCGGVWTNRDQVQPLFPRHLSPLACIHPPPSSLPPFLSALLLPPLSLEGRQSEICACVWRRGSHCSSRPCCSPLRPLTGDCWRSQLAGSWPIRPIWYRKRMGWGGGGGCGVGGSCAHQLHGCQEVCYSVPVFGLPPR